MFGIVSSKEERNLSQMITVRTFRPYQNQHTNRYSHLQIAIRRSPDLQQHPIPSPKFWCQSSKPVGVAEGWHSLSLCTKRHRCPRVILGMPLGWRDSLTGQPDIHCRWVEIPTQWYRGKSTCCTHLALRHCNCSCKAHRLSRCSHVGCRSRFSRSRAAACRIYVRRWSAWNNTPEDRRSRRYSFFGILFRHYGTVQGGKDHPYQSCGGAPHTETSWRWTSKLETWSVPRILTNISYLW